MNFREILIRIIGMTTPYVYDNNISLLELVRRLYKFVNELATCVQDLDKEFTDLKDYVNNYFDNLDISSEIKSVLNEMIEDGTLAEIINDELLGNINNEITSIKETLATVNSTLESHATELNYLTYRDRFQVANCSANSNYAITNSNFTIQNDDVIFIHFNEALDGTKDATLTINGIAKSVITKDGSLYKGSDIQNQDIILRVTDAGLIQVVDILYFQEQINDNKEAITELQSSVESNTGDINNLKPRVSTLETNVSNNTNSINTLNENIDKFNLGTAQDCTINHTIGSLKGIFRVSKDDSSSVCKAYGAITFTGQGTEGTNNVTITNTGLTISEEFTVHDAGIRLLYGNDNSLFDIHPISLNFKTNGSITFSFSVTGTVPKQRVIFFPCLYFLKNLGD